MATFGNTNAIAGTPGTPSGLGQFFDNRFFGCKAAPASDGLVTSVTAYVQAQDVNKFFRPVIVLASTKQIITNGVGNAVNLDATVGAPAWVTATFPVSPAVLAGVPYYIGIVGGGNATFWGGLWFDTGQPAGSGLYDASNDFTTPTNPTDGSEETEWPSHYATYTPSGGGPQLKTLSGTLTPTGTLTKQTRASRSGVLGLSAVGAVKTAFATLLGTLTSAGALTGVKTGAIVLVGTRPAATWAVPVLALVPGAVTLTVTPPVATWTVPALALAPSAVTLSGASPAAGWAVPPLTLAVSGTTVLSGATPVTTWTVPPLALLPSAVGLTGTSPGHTWAVPTLALVAPPLALTGVRPASTWAVPPLTLTVSGSVALAGAPAAVTWTVPTLTLTRSVMSYRDHVVVDGANHYWRLNDTGATALDALGTAHGTINAGVTKGAVGALPNDADRAMTFNGTTGTIVSAVPIALTPPCTIEAWINTTGASANKAWFSTRRAADAGTVLVGSTGTTVWARNGTGSADAVGVGSVIGGVWRHVVAVFTGTVVGLYIDGTLVASPPFVWAGSSAFAPTIGWDELTNAFWPGGIDEVALYPRALSSADISAHWDARVEGAGIAGVPGWLLGDDFMAYRYNVWRAIAPSDTVDLPQPTDAVLVGVGGNVAAVMQDNSVTVLTLPAGAWVPIAARRINSTGTTATGLVAMNDV